MPILEKIKTAYLLWYEYYQILPKTHRHTIGLRVDNLFTDIIEAVSVATFLSPTEKILYVRLAIRKINAINIFILILWENKSLDNKQYLALSVQLNEIGKQLGGWNGQLLKQNSPDNKSREK